MIRAPSVTANRACITMALAILCLSACRTAPPTPLTLPTPPIPPRTEPEKLYLSWDYPVLPAGVDVSFWVYGTSTLTNWCPLACVPSERKTNYVWSFEAKEAYRYYTVTASNWLGQAWIPYKMRRR